jgi:hypothetical protein
MKALEAMVMNCRTLNQGQSYARYVQAQSLCRENHPHELNQDGERRRM